MANWTPQDWLIFFTGLAAFIGTTLGTVLTAYNTFLTNKTKNRIDRADVKLDAVTEGMAQNSEKLDINTKITKAGVKVAANNARDAVAASMEAKEAVVEAKEATTAMAADVSKKLNGGLDHSVAKAVAPIKVTLQEHQMVITELMEEHAKNMAEVQKQFREISDYIHRRNQEILDKFSTTAYGVQAILEMLKADREGRKHTETRVD